MSFQTPALLLALLALPALGAWYLSRQRARRQAASAFAATPMTASVLPDAPGWRRHAPLAVLALALAALILAAARPRVQVSTTVAQLSTMLALDMSGSMQARDIAPTRATAAQRAADVFIGGVPGGVAVGVMQFNQTPQVLATPTRNHHAAIEALGRLRIGGGTAIGSAVDTALALLRPASAPADATAGSGGGDQRSGATAGGGSAAAQSTASGKASAAIVLLSDGKSTSGADPLAAARAARRLHIPVFTVAIGTPGGTISVARRDGRAAATVPVPVEGSELARVAELSGGRAYTAADAGHLSAIYKQLSARLSHRGERRDLTSYLLGAGLGLLLIGSALSLGWFGRLI
jgi:Ca-activated chloride channel family protein